MRRLVTGFALLAVVGWMSFLCGAQHLLDYLSVSPFAQEYSVVVSGHDCDSNPVFNLGAGNIQYTGSVPHYWEQWMDGYQASGWFVTSAEIKLEFLGEWHVGASNCAGPAFAYGQSPELRGDVPNQADRYVSLPSGWLALMRCVYFSGGLSPSTIGERRAMQGMWAAFRAGVMVIHDDAGGQSFSPPSGWTSLGQWHVGPCGEWDGHTRAKGIWGREISSGWVALIAHHDTIGVAPPFVQVRVILDDGGAHAFTPASFRAEGLTCVGAWHVGCGAPDGNVRVVDSKGLEISSGWVGLFVQG